MQDNTSFANPNADLAITSVAAAESAGGQATIVNSIGAQGLFQDYRSRATSLDNYLTSNGLTLSSVDGQAQNMLNELGSGQYGPTVAALNNPNLTQAQTEEAFTHNFENPGATGEATDAANSAYYDNLVGNNPTMVGDETGGLASTPSTASDYEPSFSTGMDSQGGLLGPGGEDLGVTSVPNYSVAQNMADPSGMNAIGEPSLGEPSFDPSLGGITTSPYGDLQGAQPSIGADLSAASGVGDLGITFPTISSDPVATLTSAVSGLTGTAGASSIPAAINAQTQGDAADTNAADTTAQTVAQGQQAATTGFIANIENYLTDWTGRGVVIILGLILIAAGLFMLKPAQEVITRSVKAGAEL